MMLLLTTLWKLMLLLLILCKVVVVGNLELGVSETSSNPTLVNNEESVSFVAEFDDDSQDTDEDDCGDIGDGDFTGDFWMFEAISISI